MSITYNDDPYKLGLAIEVLLYKQRMADAYGNIGKESADSFARAKAILHAVSHMGDDGVLKVLETLESIKGFRYLHAILSEFKNQQLKAKVSVRLEDCVDG